MSGDNKLLVDSKRTSSTRVLSRILIYLSEINSRANVTVIKTNVCSSGNNVKDGIIWLLKNKILIKKKISGTTFYSINPKWVEL